MKFSIITVCFNSEKTIADTIRSVGAQRYSDLEHVIIDGGSKDRTLDIVREIGLRNGTVVSGPDEGIYDAMNKGLQAATGDVVCFLNSDDAFADDQVVARIAESFEKSGSPAVYGDVCFVGRDQTEKVVRRWVTGAFDPRRFRRGWQIPHPAIFISRELFDRYGGFNTEYTISADYDLMLRLFYKHRIVQTYCPIVVARMRHGGASNRSLQVIFKGNRECYHAWMKNGGGNNPDIVLWKLARKVAQLRFS